MQISVKSDVYKALKSMRGLQGKQMPFAAALGLTMTAKKVAKVEQRVMVRKLFYLCTLGSSSNLTAIPFKSGPAAG
jgi:hypothetical protein